MPTFALIDFEYLIPCSFILRKRNDHLDLSRNTIGGTRLPFVRGTVLDGPGCEPEPQGGSGLLMLGFLASLLRRLPLRRFLPSTSVNPSSSPDSADESVVGMGSASISIVESSSVGVGVGTGAGAGPGAAAGAGPGADVGLALALVAARTVSS